MNQIFSPPPPPVYLPPPPPWYRSPPPPNFETWFFSSPPPPSLLPPPRPPSPPPSPSSISAGNLIAVSFVALLPPGLIFLIYFLFLRKRNTPASTPTPTPATTGETISTEPQRERRGGLDIATVQMFPVLLNSDVRQLKEAQGQIECAICMSEFEDDDILRMLPGCCHVFHLECIGTWLALRVTCPVCRINLKEIDVQHV